MSKFYKINKDTLIINPNVEILAAETMPHVLRYKKIKHIVLPESLKNVEFLMFAIFPNLETYSIDENNPHFSVVDGILFNKDKTRLLHYPSGKNNTYYKIPDGVDAICATAFRYAKNLKEISIPESVTYIYDIAFESCKSLEKINIPGSVFTIDNAAFSYCPSLKEININNGVKTLGNRVFEGCTSLTDIVIPDSVTVLGTNIFSQCNSLKSVLFSRNLKMIPAFTFYECSNLVNLTFGDNISNIDCLAFHHCNTTKIKINRCASPVIIQWAKDNHIKYTNSELSLFLNNIDNT